MPACPFFIADRPFGPPEVGVVFVPGALFRGKGASFFEGGEGLKVCGVAVLAEGGCEHGVGWLGVGVGQAVAKAARARRTARPRCRLSPPKVKAAALPRASVENCPGCGAIRMTGMARPPVGLLQ